MQWLILLYSFQKRDKTKAQRVKQFVHGHAGANWKAKVGPLKFDFRVTCA